MNEKYYYLVSSMPTLKFGEKPPMTVDGFLSECERWMGEKEMAVLLSLKGQDPRGTEKYPVISEWVRFDRRIKRSLAEAREAVKKGASYKAGEEVKDILAAETPLEAEKMIERYRWDFMEDKVLHYNFDVNWVILYMMKLKIAERLSRFDKEKGEEAFYKACEVKHEQVIGKDSIS